MNSVGFTRENSPELYKAFDKYIADFKYEWDVCHNL